MALKVLVTAGGAGIGREIARAFIETGAEVYVCDIDDGALKVAASEMPDLKTGNCDVGDPAAVEKMVTEAVGLLGGLDVLVNNAGIGGPTRAVQDIQPDEWNRVIAVNLSGAFNVTRLCVPHLIKSGRGVIINMTSIGGRKGFPLRSPYSAAKSGLIGFTKTLAVELGQYGIRANAIAPGSVDGDRVRRIWHDRAAATGTTVEEVQAALTANQSLKRFVDPRDIGALAVFLASDAGKSISGQVIPIDNDLQRL
ncbi:MAG: SDR family oxidoreductase [Rhodobiaceae bacterium]|nr:SDR family oxidoreductase [Rhodobiaceae bacterium]MCC0057096.1 SDR family oxidoreductase [Rhodobiaceae bacterium]